jgi:short-subunit dehydrogenase
MDKIKGKHVLLTGASGEIGRAVAGQLHASGAILYITGRNPERLMEVASSCSIPSDRTFPADLRSAAEVSLMAKQIHAQTPQLDIIIHAAGIGIIKPIEQLTEEDLRISMETNFYSFFHIMKEFLPPMKTAGKGLVINIPGVLGKTPMAGASVYAAAKYALNGFIKSVREELKRTEIRISEVFLGGVDSAFWDSIEMRVQRDKMIKPDDAARAIWYLCQQPSSGVVSELVLQPFNHQAI